MSDKDYEEPFEEIVLEEEEEEEDLSKKKNVVGGKSSGAVQFAAPATHKPAPPNAPNKTGASTSS